MLENKVHVSIIIYSSLENVVSVLFKGGVTDEISLSAYITIALLEDGVSIEVRDPCH